MNSQYGRLSAEEMRERQKQMIGKAESVTPTVAVMESNWRAMIDSQNLQVNILTDILTKLDSLTTKQELVDYLNQQLEILRKENSDTKASMEQHREAMQTQAAETKTKLTEAASNLEAQAGKLQEKFGSALSQEQERMDKHTGKLFWISLIPSLTLLALEAMPHIWQLIFPS